VIKTGSTKFHIDQLKGSKQEISLQFDLEENIQSIKQQIMQLIVLMRFIVLLPPYLNNTYAFVQINTLVVIRYTRFQAYAKARLFSTNTSSLITPKILVWSKQIRCHFRDICFL